MSFYVAKNDTEFDSLMSAETLMKSSPDYYAPRFEALKDLRAADDGTIHKGNEFRRVASFTNVPLFMAQKLADPTFLLEKKQLYAFIDRHPEFCTYQRRNRGRGTHADDIKLPLSVLGLEGPVKVTEHEVPDEYVPDSAEGTVGE